MVLRDMGLPLGMNLFNSPVSRAGDRGGAWPASALGVEGWLAAAGTVAPSRPPTAGITSKLGATCQGREIDSLPTDTFFVVVNGTFTCPEQVQK